MFSTSTTNATLQGTDHGTPNQIRAQQANTQIPVESDGDWGLFHAPGMGQ